MAELVKTVVDYVYKNVKLIYHPHCHSYHYDVHSEKEDAAVGDRDIYWTDCSLFFYLILMVICAGIA